MRKDRAANKKSAVDSISRLRKVTAGSLCIRWQPCRQPILPQATAPPMPLTAIVQVCPSQLHERELTPLVPVLSFLHSN